MKARVFLAWYDCWIGGYYDRKRRVLYICPLPMIVIEIQMSIKRGESE